MADLSQIFDGFRNGQKLITSFDPLIDTANAMPLLLNLKQNMKRLVLHW